MKRAFRYVALPIVWLVFAEAVLFVATLLSPAIDQALLRQDERAQIAPWLPDAELEKRGNPRYRDHDEDGFRNPRALERADIVVLGDSQSYGTSVFEHEAWPARLADLRKEPVYNMAFPSYGPYHASLLLDDALAKRPRIVVVSLYLGNDFYDVFRLLWREDSRAKWYAPEAIADLEAEERQMSFDDKVRRVLVPGVSAEPEESVEIKAPSGGQAIKRFLSDHLHTYRLARAVRDTLRHRALPSTLAPSFDAAVAALTDDHAHCCSVFASGTWRTILTAPYRHAVLDASDPRIVESVPVTIELLSRMADAAREGGARLVVVQIPTKETVFAPRVEAAAKHPHLEAIVADEAAFRTRVAHALEARGIPHLDVTPALRAAPTQPYFENADGHPNPLGHRIIAAEVARRLRAVD